jgi:lambda family phage portal protein
MSSYTGGQSNRFFSDWVTDLTDPNDDYWLDGSILAARSWDLWRNDPYFHALVETMVELAIGPEGLIPRSQYQEDDAPETDPEEQVVRDQIDSGLKRGLSGTRLDASGILSYAEMSEAVLRSCKVAGMGYAVRVWKPKRPNATHGTAWRVIDPARVSNPNHGADTPRLFQGHELDADGREVAIYVQKSHPNIQRIAQASEWQRIPIYDADGMRQVTMRRNGGRPEQIRTVGCGAPVILYLRMLQGTTEAWAIAKRIQASYALMIKTEDPADAAKADRYGSLLSGNVPIRPGQRYYHNHESVEPLNWNFQGTDYENFRNPIVEAVCACEGLPYEMVLKRLTKSNMASSRAALMQAYQFGKREQNRQILSTEQHWAASITMEDVARGNVDPRTDDRDIITNYKWRRPPRPWPDPQREAQAIKAWVDMGHSYSSAYDEVGKDFEEEIRQRARDERLIAAQKVTVSPDIASAPAPQPVVNTEEPESPDDENENEDEDEKEQDMKPSELRAMFTEFAANLRPAPAAPQPVTVVNEQRISMDADSARLMGSEMAKAMAATPAPVVNVSPAIVNMAAAAAPSVTVNVEPSPVHVQAAAAPEPVAPVVNVNLPAPIVTIDNRVEVPARTVIAKPNADGSVTMTPQE